jgi:hypothetical protein
MLAALALIAHITVQPGDTLSGIAASQGVSLSALEAANPQIADPDLIIAGQGLSVPGSGTSSEGSSSSSTSTGSGSSQPSGSGYSASPSPSEGGNGSSSSQSSSPGPSSPSPSGSSASSTPAASSNSGGLSSVPGVPSSFAACVAYHESTNGSNAAYNGGVYGIITASGVNVNGQGIGAQKAAFSYLYSHYGTKPWAGDGC